MCPYFCYYSWVSLYFLILFMSLTVLFQLEVAKSKTICEPDTTHKPEMTNPFINRSWVEAKRV